MATITTRSGKGSPLTNDEVDSNFTNLNTDKVEKSGDTLTGNLSFGDNNKVILGDGSDLQIYHDGSHSFVKDAGAGILYVQGSTQVRIGGADGTTGVEVNEGGDVKLRYNNANKLETTSSGINVTGSVVSDGLTVDAGGEVATFGNILANNFISVIRTDLNPSKIQLGASSNQGVIRYIASNGFKINDITSGEKRRLEINSNGDVSFYEDTGTTAKLTWDASAESLNFADNGKAIFGAGSDLEIYHDGSSSYIVDNGTGNLRLQGVVQVADDPSSNDGRIYFGDSSNAQGIIHYDYSLGDLFFENTWANSAGVFKFKANSVIALTVSDSGIDVTGSITTDGMTTSADINFGDNDKAVFGAGSDLQIFHDGSNSYVKDAGTGSLFLEGTNQIKLSGAAGDYFLGQNNGSAYLYYAGALKFYTTSTGIDVTGTVVSDGLDLDIANTNGTSGITFNRLGGASSIAGYGSYSQGIRVWLDKTDSSSYDSFEVVAQSTELTRLSINNDGDVSFYEDTGTTPKFFWDASSERLGLGTSSPNETMHLEVSDGHTQYIQFGLTSIQNRIGVTAYDNVVIEADAQNANANSTVKLNVDGSTKLTASSTGINVTGSVTAEDLIADTTRPEIFLKHEGTQLGGLRADALSKLELKTTASYPIFIQTNATNVANFAVGGDVSFYNSSGTSQSLFWDASAESLGIGTTSPSQKLHVNGKTVFFDDNGATSATYSFEANHFSSITITGDKDSSHGGPWSNQVVTNGSNGRLELRTNNTAHLYITQAGNVGIGTATPDADLEVVGTIKLNADYPVGVGNLAMGVGAGDGITTGNNNISFGRNAGTAISSGSNNIAIGSYSQDATTTGTHNVSVGYGTLSALTTGTRNVAIGNSALSVATADRNVAIGSDAGLSVTIGTQNVYVGEGTGRSATTASYNVMVGRGAGSLLTTASNSVGLGHQALSLTTTGGDNTAVGRRALYTNTTSSKNVAVGHQALLNATNGPNTAVGASALQSLTSGYDNTAVGRNAGYSITTGIRNCAFGDLALDVNTTGNYNTALGASSLGSNTTATGNTAVGYQSLVTNSTGVQNTAVGANSLYSNTTGGEQVAVGRYAGYSNTTGGSNVYLGYEAGRAGTTASNNVAIGRIALKNNGLGERMVAVGYNALGNVAPTTVNHMYQVAVGYSAGGSITTGTNNTVVGGLALDTLTTGSGNVAVGYQALTAATTSSNNTAIGQNALRFTTTGAENVAVGRTAMEQNTVGSRATAVGYEALKGQNPTSATNTYNVGLGFYAGRSITTGISNTHIGSLAGDALTTGSNNTTLGHNAGGALTVGVGNTFIGQQAGTSMTTGSKNTILGRYTGNHGGLDIRTLNNHIVLSDGDGNPRLHIDSTGKVKVESKITTQDVGTDFIIGQYDNDIDDTIGDVYLQQSGGGRNGDQGNLYIHGSQDSVGTGDGGLIEIRGARSGSGDGGDVEIYGGTQTSNRNINLAQRAGDVTITGGEAINAVAGTASRPAGSVTLRAGQNTAQNDQNGDINLQYHNGTNYVTSLTVKGDDGNVGIGSDPAKKLDVYSTTDPTIRISNGGGTSPNPKLEFFRQTGVSGTIQYDVANKNMLFVNEASSANAIIWKHTSSAEAMRIDSSGNLLVGTTSASGASAPDNSGTASDAGIRLSPTGFIGLGANQAPSGYFNRIGNDGDIVRFNKDGSTVGSIGTASSGNLYLEGSGNHSGFEFGSNVIAPFKQGASTTGICSLGSSQNTYKDLYLSGGIYVGGTGSANKLDDYEEGTWTGKVADAESGGNESATNCYGYYTKVGNMVYVHFNVQNIDTTGLTGSNDVYITGLPFTSNSATGNAKYTGTAHMSVVAFAQTPILDMNESATAVRIAEVRNGAGVDHVIVSQLTSLSSDIHGNLVYQTV